MGTRRQEAAMQMTELLRTYPQAAPLIVDILAQNQDWPGADVIAKRFKVMLPQQIQEIDGGDLHQAQMQQMQQQMQQMQQQFMMQLQQVQQEAQQLQAENTSIKQDRIINAKKLEIDAYNAETDRLKTVQMTMTPEQMQGVVLKTLSEVLDSPDISEDSAEEQPQEAQTAQPTNEGM